jgi:hypothetical protein
MLTLQLPWPSKLLSPNKRGHWGQKSEAIAMYRMACASIASRAWTPFLFPFDAKLAITYWFFPPDNRRYALDNLHARMKSGQDGIADGLRFDDKIIRRVTCEFGEVLPKDGQVNVTLRADRVFLCE